MALNKKAKDMIEKKWNDSKAIIEEAFSKFDDDRMAVAYTGGKDSTLLLWLVKAVCEEKGRPLPKCFCIDEGDMFDEVKEFIKEIEDKTGARIEMIHNSDVSRAAGGELGATVSVDDLNEFNQAEIERLGYDEDEFPYEPESFVGNHLMKTATLNRYLFDNEIEAFFEGIRWDEQGARADETYFSEREETEFNPEHTRIFPILHFTERDVWDATFHYNIPMCKLYQEGYRSLGARVTTGKTTDIPAWEQDIENTDERGGRRQDKEGLMEKLRQLGYM